MPALVLPLLVLLFVLPCWGAESLDAYIPAAHKTLYESFNAIVLGDASLARAAIRGPLAVMGHADLADFSIAQTGECDRDARSLVVGGALTARMGVVHNGYVVVGKRSNIQHTVRRSCTTRTEQYDPARNGDIEFDEMRTNVLRESAELCITEPSGTVEEVNGTLTFTPGEKGYSCYTFFKLRADDLRLVKKWEFAGDDLERNIIITISGLKVDFRDFEMHGFNAARTLIVFCSVYGNFGLYGAKFHGSVLAATSSFTATSAIFNGSIIVGSLRGSLAALSVEYKTC